MGIRTLLLATLVAAATLAACAGEDNANPARVPVLVELFTSEGCSSCPAADALLIELDQKQGLPQAEIIALGEHVDYWNDLGWRDRFSSAEFTRRQQDYAARFHLSSAYTPQMVVDGRYQLVGNDAGGVRKTVEQALRAGKPARVLIARSAPDKLDITVENAPSGAEVLFAVTESALSTAVGRGENQGRTLRHTAVVRQLLLLGKTKAGRFTAGHQLKLDREWKRENLKAVAFVQDRASGLVLGAAAIALK